MTAAPFPASAAFAPTPALSWLAVAAMLTDLVFETDPQGRFSGFGPGKVLNQPSANLLGVELATLLAPGEDEPDALSAAQFRAIIATICTECVAWHGRVRLLLIHGGTGLYRLSLAPRMAGGKVIGTYGMMFDLEAPELALPHLPAPPPPLHSTLLDVETGLWLGRTFADEIARRFDRLDVEELPGTLLYLGFSRAPAHLRSAIVMRMAEELRDIVRPTDLLGRIDETTVALWCDNMDHLTGGERAARFCTTLPALLPERSLITVGVAPRWPGSGDDPSSVMEHAAVALRLADMAVERAKGETTSGAWRVWQRD
jgi:GGDEF domain-containing protein